MSTSPRSILVVVTRRIGDVLLATPVMRSLKRAWPQAAIDALVFEGTGGVLAGNPDLRTVITVAERPARRAHLALARNLWRRYDLALSLLPGDRPTVYAWLAGRSRAGFVVDAPNQRWKRWLLDHALPYDNADTHTVDLYLRVLAPLGVVPQRTVVAGWTEEDAARVAGALAGAGIAGAFAVLHTSPMFPYKAWTDAGWRAVGEWLAARGLRVVLTGGPAAAERAAVAALAQTLPAAADLAGRFSLAETACLLAQARLYVGPDTAITHLAAALDVPTVALFGPSDPVKWGPWPARHADGKPWARYASQRTGNVVLLQGRAACVPCLLEGCERRLDSLSDCLQQLPPARVIAAAAALLDERPAR